MLNQLYVTTFLIFMPLIFIIWSSVIIIKNLNLINPSISKKISGSGIIFRGLGKLTVVEALLFILFFAYGIYITYVTKELIFFVFAMFILSVVTISIGITYANIYKELSNFELRVANIKEIVYSDSDKETFKNIKNKVTLIAIVAVLIHFAIIALDIVIGSESFPILLLMFILGQAVFPICSVYLKKQILLIQESLLKKQKGYLNNKDLLDFKNNLKEQRIKLEDIKEARDSEIKKFKNKKEK